MSINPYAAPSVEHFREPETDVELIRREHLNHEASVQSIGSLYLIATILPLVAIIAAWFENGSGFFERLIISCIMLGFATISGLMAYGLMRLRPWARISGIVLTVPGLLFLPIGTLINGYILYLLLSGKGKMVFSPEYRAVITATPHIKYRMSIILWIGLILVFVLFVVAFIAALVGRR